jgi:hypothetical protein
LAVGKAWDCWRSRSFLLCCTVHFYACASGCPCPTHATRGLRPVGGLPPGPGARTTPAVVYSCARATPNSGSRGKHEPRCAFRRPGTMHAFHFHPS